MGLKNSISWFFWLNWLLYSHRHLHLINAPMHLLFVMPTTMAHTITEPLLYIYSSLPMYLNPCTPPKIMCCFCSKSAAVVEGAKDSRMQNRISYMWTEQIYRWIVAINFRDVLCLAGWVGAEGGGETGCRSEICASAVKVIGVIISAAKGICICVWLSSERLNHHQSFIRLPDSQTDCHPISPPPLLLVFKFIHSLAAAAEARGIFRGTIYGFELEEEQERYFDCAEISVSIVALRFAGRGWPI